VQLVIASITVQDMGIIRALINAPKEIRASPELVVTIASVHLVGLPLAIQQVVPGVAIQVIETSRSEDGVVAAATVDEVRRTTAIENVGLGVPVQPIRVSAAYDLLLYVSPRAHEVLRDPPSRPNRNDQSIFVAHRVKAAIAAVNGLTGTGGIDGSCETDSSHNNRPLVNWSRSDPDCTAASAPRP
jgi:hypothetical protein